MLSQESFDDDEDIHYYKRRVKVLEREKGQFESVVVEIGEKLQKAKKINELNLSSCTILDILHHIKRYIEERVNQSVCAIEFKKESETDDVLINKNQADEAGREVIITQQFPDIMVLNKTSDLEMADVNSSIPNTADIPQANGDGNEICEIRSINGLNDLSQLKNKPNAEVQVQSKGHSLSTEDKGLDLHHQSESTGKYTDAFDDTIICKINTVKEKQDAGKGKPDIVNGPASNKSRSIYISDFMDNSKNNGEPDVTKTVSEDLKNKEDENFKSLTDVSVVDTDYTLTGDKLGYIEIKIEPDNIDYELDVCKSKNNVTKAKQEGSKNVAEFSCELCDYSTRLKNNLKRHFKTHLVDRHCSIKERKSFNCGQCNYTTYFKYNLNRHIKKVHSKEHEERPTYVCEYCGRELHTKYAHTIHVKTLHEKVFKYICLTCGKGFNQKIAYQDHLAAHSNSLKLKCDLCPASFKYTSSLKEHKSSVHSNVYHKCPDSSCSSLFKSIQSLKAHVRVVHYNEKVQCDICCQTFKWRSSLQNHKRAVHYT